MKIQKTTIQKIILTDLVGLDPIDVMLEDIEPGKGRITIRCYTKAWTAYWGGMGNRTIAQFYCDCDEHYIAGSMAPDVSPSLQDAEAVIPVARREICKMRRSRDIKANKAAELWAGIESISGDSHTGLFNHSEILVPIFGDDWWHSIPKRPNPDYEYICRIIKAVQSGMRELLAEVPA